MAEDEQREDEQDDVEAHTYERPFEDKAVEAVERGDSDDVEAHAFERPVERPVE